MNINSLIKNFQSYLISLESKTDKKYDIENPNVSIYKYSDEFKAFVADELDISDVSIFSTNINDLLDMEVVDGKLVDNSEGNTDTFAKNENNEDEVPVQAEENSGNNAQTGVDGEAVIPNGETVTSGAETNTGAPEGTNAQNNIMDIINNLLADDEVIKALDADGSKVLEDEEIDAFLEAINELDGDIENLSIEDIIGGIEHVKNGTYVDGEIVEAEEVKEDEKVEETSKANNATPVNSTGSSGGGMSGVGYSGSSAPVEKTLENMNKEELNAELKTAQGDLSEKQDKLSAILDGSDSTISELKENMDTAFETYQEELGKVDKDMAEDLNDLKESIDNKEKEIDTKEQEISDQEGVLADSETAYGNALSNKRNWESIISTLEGTDTSEMDDKKKGEISQKLSDAKGKLEEAKDTLETADEKRDKAKEDLETLKEEKDTLISGDKKSGLDALNKQMQDLEAKILEKHPAIKEYMDAYKDAKQEYTDTKSKMITDAKAEVNEAQTYVNEVQTAISNYDNKQNEREYTVNDFEAAVEWARKYDNFSQSDIQAIFSQLGYDFHYDAWCGDFVRMALMEGVGEENLPDWYRNCSNKAFCPTLQDSAQGHEISAEDAKPGDMVLFDWDGDGCADHVGLFVDNGNGSTTITAIEGNTSGSGGGSCVEEKARDRGNIIGIYSMSN